MKATKELESLAAKLLDSIKQQKRAEIEAILYRGALVDQARAIIDETGGYWVSGLSLEQWIRENLIGPDVPSRRLILGWFQISATFGPEGEFPTDLDTLANLDTSALTDLAGCWEDLPRKQTGDPPRENPPVPEAVTECVRRAKSGEYITRKEARVVIGDYRDPKRQPIRGG